MSREPRNETAEAPSPEPAKKPRLEPPRVITYSGDDILEELGPAHACNPFSGSVVSCD